jgi:protein AbiQ
MGKIAYGRRKTEKIKGSLRFNFMFPVPDNMITPRIIKNEINEKRRIFLYEQLKFCNKNYDLIIRQAKRTYTIITKKLNPTLTKNSCDFKLLEKACRKWEKQ